MTERPEDLVGQVLAGRYRILGLLGTGAMGAVYIGEHLRMGRRDAIKVIHKAMAHDPETIARFNRGARNVSAVRHPNVCTIYDFSDTDDGHQFMAMEYIEGETLKDILDREGRLELHRAIDIARQVAAALQAAHDVGIVHRDLKPGNVMISTRPDGSDAVKVVDFDIAKGPAEAEGEEVTRLGFVVGTPEYMSPEQLTGEPLDGRSDVYSLGIVLFRMLTGSLPFRAATTQDIMIQRLTVEPLRLDEVLPGAAFPAAFDELFRRALARSVAGRYESAAAFAADLNAAAAAGSAAASTAGAGGDLAATRVEPARPRPQPAGQQQTQTSPPPRPRMPAGAQQAPPSQRRPPLGSKRGLAAAGIAVVAVLAVGATLLFRPAADAVTTNGTAPTTDVASPGIPDLSSDLDGRPPVVPDATLPDPPPAAGNGAPAAAPTPAAPALPGPVGNVLARQIEALMLEPGPATLRAIRDTAGIAWNVATQRRDSADAAWIMAQVALVSGDEAECVRWARRGAAVEPLPSFDILIEQCR
jgi:eukaryotic-like serine/threonine-protein kinase